MEVTRCTPLKLGRTKKKHLFLQPPAGWMFEWPRYISEVRSISKVGTWNHPKIHVNSMFFQPGYKYSWDHLKDQSFPEKVWGSTLLRKKQEMPSNLWGINMKIPARIQFNGFFFGKKHKKSVTSCHIKYSVSRKLHMFLLTINLRKRGTKAGILTESIPVVQATAMQCHVFDSHKYSLSWFSSHRNEFPIIIMFFQS
jgi:hypothetical protein